MTDDKIISAIRLVTILLLIPTLFCLWMQAADAAPSLSISKTLSTTGYQTGSPGVSSNFKIVITNNGNSSLNSVTLTDLMPSGITFTGATPTPSSSTPNMNGSTTITWNLGTMSPGDSKTIYPRATRNGKVFGSVVNNAVVTGKDQAGRTILSSSAYSVTLLKPNVKIVEIASPSSGASCTDLTFVISIFNTGNDTFNSVSVSDLLPKGISYNSEGTLPQPNSVNNYNNGTINLTWNDLGYLGVGGSKTITLKARITGDVYGQLMDGLKVMAKPPRDVAYYAVNTTSAKVQALKSGVELYETVSPPTGSSGTVTDFAINISNTGEVPLRLELIDTIPEGLIFVSSNPAGSELGKTIKWSNLGDLHPGNAIPVHLTAKIDGQKYGTLVNRATVTGWPLEGCSVTDEDSKELTSYRSGLRVNETPIPESGAPGSCIDFEIDVTNTGEVDLDEIKVEDLLPGGLSYSSASIDPTEKKVEENGITSVMWNNILSEPLAPNASASIHMVAVLDGSHSGSLQNKISATGLTSEGFNVTGEDMKSVTAFMSGIQVAEAAVPDSGSPGTLVDFKIDLTNAGEVNLESLKLVDLLPKGLSFRSASIDPAEIKVNDNGTTTVSWNDIQIAPLVPGTSKSIHLTTEIDGAQYGIIQNSIVANGTPTNGFTITAEDKKNINAYRSAIAVVQIPTPSSGSPGTLVDFKIGLTNTGEVNLDVVNLVDILSKGLRYSSASFSPTENRVYDNGTTSIVWENVLTAPLAPGASKSIHLIAAIEESNYGSLQNKISAVGTPPTGSNVTAEDEKSITIQKSAVQVSLTSSSDSGSPGTLVDLGIDVTNTGEVNLDVVKLLYLLPKGLSYSSASVNPTERIVDATGDMSLTWNNILAAPLTPNATTTIHLSAKIDEIQPGLLHNIVTATGMTSTGYNVTAEFEKNITVSRSTIEVSETPTPESGCPGTLVDYRIDITNTGDVNLDAVKVADLLPKGLIYSSSSIDPNKKTVHHNKSTSVTWNNILAAPLAPTETATIHFTAKIDEVQPGLLQNIVTATGMTPTGYDVSAEDKKNITVSRSAIKVSETPAPESGCPGTLVDYKIDITNTGDVNLDAVKLVDMLPKGLIYSSSSINPNKKTLHHNKSTSVTWNNILTSPLVPTGTATIHLTAKIDEDQPVSLQNIVTATGMTPTGYDVSAEDEKNITVSRSSIDISETPTPESGCPGTLVDYKIDITNTGDVNLDAVKVVDLLPRGLIYSSSSIDPNKKTVHRNKTTSVVWNNILAVPLAPNASSSFHLVSEIDGTQQGSLQNIITATGMTTTGYNMTAKDEKNITVCRSAIQVSETATPESGGPGTLVNFKINIANKGDRNLDAIKVVDLLPKGLAFVSSTINSNKKTVHNNKSTSVTWNNILTAPLVPNASTSFHLVSEIDGTQSGLLQNIVKATGTTPTGYDTTAEDEKNITARKSAIQIAAVPTPESGNLGTLIDFKIDITNTGDACLDAVKLVDLLPKGLKYSSSSIDPTKKRANHNKTTSVTWNDVLTEPLAPNASKSIHIAATIDGTQSGLLWNKITATGRTSEGFNVTGEDRRNITARVPAIEVVTTPTPESGSLGTLIDFKIEITNAGEVNLNSVKVADLLPKGLRFSSASIAPSQKKVNSNGTTSIAWDKVLAVPLAPNSSTSIHLDARVDGNQFGPLQNRVVAKGIPKAGFIVTGEDLKNVTAYRPAIQIVETPTPSFGSLETPVDFMIEMTNKGEVDLNVVRVVDLLPKGLNYSSASIDPDSNRMNTNGSRTIIWNNISNSPLSPGSSTSIHLKAKIDGSVFGGLENKVTIKCKPYIGDCIYSSGSVTVKALRPILVSINATQDSGPKGSNIAFGISITNPSNVSIKLTGITDSLPAGLKYVSSDPAGSEVGNTVIWSNPGDLAPGGKALVKLSATIDGSKFGELNNSATVSGIISSTGHNFLGSGSLKVNALAPMLTVSKTASKKVASPGEEITYTILIVNTGVIPVKNVLVRDNFDSRIEFLFASPMPDINGLWHFSLIEPGSSEVINLTIRVPVEPEINFNADQKITGDGFVDIANRFSTNQEQYYLNNQVSVTAEDLQGYANEKVAVSSGPGTELQSNEHGSGNYSGESILQLHSKNRSVEIEKILSARARPTTFVLPGNRLEHFRSDWSDRTSAKNRISGTSIDESYRYADKIEHNSKIKLDRNETNISVRADFEGDAKMGFLRKSETVDNGQPTFDSQEHYAGRFRISEDLNEYGEDVRLNRSANGTGSVVVDKHIRKSQRTYESGSGDYRIEELIDTPTSFMAKKINLTRHPVRYDYLSGLNFTPSAGWKEGMWSKTKNTGYIVEEFEDLQHLKKATTTKGLNQLETEANFSGRSRFGALSGDNMKLDQENNGNFTIKRNLLLKGVSRFDRPHILVIKEGRTRQEEIDGVNVTVAKYKINVHNDGNTALEPVLIRDLFPPGTEFLNSSIKPMKVDTENANWTLMNLGIGSSITIDLWLKARPDTDLVNRVEVAGGYDDDKWVTASNISTTEKSWLGCCPPELYLTETAGIDPHKKTIVWYNIILKNRASGPMTAVVTAHIPNGTRFLNSSTAPVKQSQNAVRWIVMGLKPGEERPITYRSEASHDGKFIDLVHVDTSLVQGQGSVSAETSSVVLVGPTREKKGKSETNSSDTEVICPNEPPSDYNWNQEPLAECPGSCPAFSESSDEEIP